MDAFGFFVLSLGSFFLGCLCTCIVCLGTFRMAQITEALIKARVKEEIAKSNETADL